MHYFCIVFMTHTSMGLTGFDSGLEWYVSMQWVGNFHFNLSYQTIIWQQ